VHNDSYNHSDPAASLVELSTGKIMGLSMAYCDNDNPDESPLSRDNFIGSVSVSEEAYNDHWQNADGYGTLTLVENSAPVATGHLDIGSDLIIYPNPMIDNNIHLTFSSELPDDHVIIRILSMNSQVLYSEAFEKYQVQFTQQITLEGIGTGIYLMEIEIADQKFVRKFTRSNNHQ